MKILDCTLRDGSYAINFQFTSQDTADICRALDAAGIDLIEVGHGVGFNASNAGFGTAAETDEEYLKAAAANVRRARFGMFCIPGIARLEDVDLGASYGMGFIRIGTNATEVASSAPFIERARKHGMLVCSNLMKSYTMPPERFALMARLCQSYGTHTLYVVDSAGGMLPDDLTRYFRAIQDVCDLPLAFHGHDNLGLGVYNSLHALSLGATLVDSSLQGMGRSSGNPATESLVAAMTRMGYDTGLDLLALMDAGEQYVRPLMTRRGIRSLDVVCGLAQFHSSYMGIIRTMCIKHGVDPRRLILAVCKEDRVNAPPDLVERCALKLRGETPTPTGLATRFHLEDYFGEEQGPSSFVRPRRAAS
jgi:4-hydroxy-2-oxovalerate aldolase